MDAKPAENRATPSRRLIGRVHGRRAAPRFGRAPSAPAEPPPTPHRLAPFARFLAAALIPFAAALLQRSYYPHFTWALFYPAAFASSWIGGTRAGILATVEAAALGWFFFTPPEESWPMHGYYAFVPVGLFILMGAIVSVSHGRLKRVTREWQAASRELSELFEMASDGIFLSDRAGRYTDVNSAACRILGRSREELIGKTISDLVRPGRRRGSRRTGSACSGPAGCRWGSGSSSGATGPSFPSR